MHGYLQPGMPAAWPLRSLMQAIINDSTGRTGSPLPCGPIAWRRRDHCCNDRMARLLEEMDRHEGVL
ncbi:hypothetical protein D2917_19040 [Cupriavidus oxalaticus]|uniref:Uncharacterized protein n=1 Tax=Cupriavidus oxalaticus TaxID=96344 RepID=A0A5P3VJ71_9BURK|nr:hypothetical protein D2917_19040 [Cupriavidus oxalaticus]